MNHVLVLGSNRWQLEKAAELGLSIVLVQKPNEADEEGFAHCQRVYLFDYQDLELLSLVARREHAGAPFDRVVSQSDVGQMACGHVNDLLGLAGNSAATVRTLHDKFALRTRLNELGIGPVPARLARDEQGLREFAAEFGPPVVKPRMGHSSVGVRVLGDGDDLGEVWAWWQRFGAGDCLLEQRLVGREISAESFSGQGRHVVVATTDKVQRGVIELGHTVPATLGEDQLRDVRALVSATMDAAGVVDGPGHTEVMLTDDGPRVVEAHSRRPGDMVNLLIDLVFGVDMETETFRLALGGRDVGELEYVRPLGRAASIRFATAAPGHVTAVEVEDWVRTEPGVVALRVETEPGDVVGELRWSFDRCGWVAVVADGPDAARELAGRCADAVHVTTRQLDVPATEESMADLLRAELGETVEPLR